MRENQYDKKLQRWTSVTVVILALSSAILSYDSLRTLAVRAGMNLNLAFLFPIVIDGLILSGSLLILFYAERGKRTNLGVFLTGLGVVASIAGNVAVSPGDVTSRLVHAAPPLVLFLSLEALTSIIRQRSKEKKMERESQKPSRTILDKTENQPQKKVEEEAPKTKALPENSSNTPTVSTVTAGAVKPPVTPKDSSSVSQPTNTAVAPRKTSSVASTPTTRSQGGKTVRETVREALQADSTASIESLLSLLDGDRKYNRKIIKEEIAKINQE